MKVAPAEIVGQPTPALEIDRDLVDPGLERHVQCVERRRIQRSCCGQPVMFLKALDTLFDVRIVEW